MSYDNYGVSVLLINGFDKFLKYPLKFYNQAHLSAHHRVKYRDSLQLLCLLMFSAADRPKADSELYPCVPTNREYAKVHLYQEDFCLKNAPTSIFSFTVRLRINYRTEIHNRDDFFCKAKAAFRSYLRFYCRQWKCCRHRLFLFRR